MMMRPGCGVAELEAELLWADGLADGSVARGFLGLGRPWICGLVSTRRPSLQGFPMAGLRALPGLMRRTIALKL